MQILIKAGAYPNNFTENPLIHEKRNLYRKQIKRLNKVIEEKRRSGYTQIN